MSSEQFVDDAVVAQIDGLALDDRLGGAVGAGVEAENRGAVGERHAGVGFGDTAHAGAEDLHRHFVVADVVAGLHDGFQRTAHVRLDDELEDALFALAQLREHAL